MNANEIVRALRDMATYDCGFEQQSDTVKDAADLIESLQDEITQLKDELADYNCDTKIGCKLIEKVKAEREKGCEYCEDGEDLSYGHDTMQRTGRIYLDGNLLTADLYSESMAVIVRFCPVCGKRLEVEP